jgi:hypothetical protein
MYDFRCTDAPAHTPNAMLIQLKPQQYPKSANVLPTISMPHKAFTSSALKPCRTPDIFTNTGGVPIPPSVTRFPAIAAGGPRTLAFPFSFSSSAKRSPTSPTVTPILITIRKIMIQVIVLIFVSAIESERISARSRKTRQRSLRTLMRGVISRYSRMAK